VSLICDLHGKPTYANTKLYHNASHKIKQHFDLAVRLQLQISNADVKQLAVMRAQHAVYMTPHVDKCNIVIEMLVALAFQESLKRILHRCRRRQHHQPRVQL